jgi:hypothetical protein
VAQTIREIKMKTVEIAGRKFQIFTNGKDYWETEIDGMKIFSNKSLAQLIRAVEIWLAV